IGLTLDGLDDPGMTMTMGDHPPGGDRIQHPAIFGVQPGALAARHQSRIRDQRVLGEGVPDRRTHVKSPAAKFSANTVFNRAAVSGSTTGKRPRRFTLPISAMMVSLSTLASPMKATPCSGISRARTASMDNSVWLM